MILIYGGIIYAVTVTGMYLVRCCDEVITDGGKKEKIITFLWSGAGAVVITGMVKMRSMTDSEALLLSVFAGCLLFACLTDVKACYVYQFIWWVAAAAAGMLLWKSYETDFRNSRGYELWMTERVIPLLFFILLQELFFCRFYGRADCHAFAVCAIVVCAFDMGMTEYLLHMILSFASLAVVQALRGNVKYNGRLKRPVAFLPYIAFSFWVLLFR